MRGLFATFEGIEGCGKTTQIGRLKTYLEGKGHTVTVTREPGGTAISEKVRDLLLDPANGAMNWRAELLLYQAARAQLVEEVIRPALDAGNTVLCDRFADSSTAYQGGGRGLPLEAVSGLHGFATDGVWPELTFVLDLPVEEGLRRATARRELDRIEQEAVDFHTRVREAYRQLADHEPERVKILDATQDIETLAAEIASLAEEALENR